MMAEVVFGPGFWGPLIATASMLLIVGIGWLLLWASHRVTKPRPTAPKLSTYACGEEVTPEEVRPGSEEFFSPIRRTFGQFYRRVTPAHAGDLSFYLFWVTMGLLVILAWIVIAMRVA